MPVKFTTEFTARELHTSSGVSAQIMQHIAHATKERQLECVKKNPQHIHSIHHPFKEVVEFVEQHKK